MWIQHVYGVCPWEVPNMTKCDCKTTTYKFVKNQPEMVRLANAVMLPSIFSIIKVSAKEIAWTETDRENNSAVAKQTGGYLTAQLWVRDEHDNVKKLATEEIKSGRIEYMYMNKQFERCFLSQHPSVCRLGSLRKMQRSCCPDSVAAVFAAAWSAPVMISLVLNSACGQSSHPLSLHCDNTIDQSRLCFYSMCLSAFTSNTMYKNILHLSKFISCK